MLYVLYKIEFCNKEKFQSTTSGYQADVEAIRNLSSIATQLTSNNTLTMPGALNVTNSLSANDNISVKNKTNEGGRIRILNSLKDGKKDQTNDWSIWNMTGGYGNKLSFWRYNGDGTNAGSLMDLNDNGTVTISGNLLIPGNNVIDLGASDATREVNAGKIGYNIWDDSLNIVGKGKPGEARRTTLWENLKLTGSLTVNNGLGMMFFGMDMGDSQDIQVKYGTQIFNASQWVCMVVGINVDWNNSSPGNMRCYTRVVGSYWNIRVEIEGPIDNWRVPILAIPIGYFQLMDTSLVNNGDRW